MFASQTRVYGSLWVLPLLPPAASSGSISVDGIRFRSGTKTCAPQRILSP